MKQQTAMQDLREDLQLTVETAKEALLEIENKGIRTACQEVVRLTLNKIIKRIDDELLEMEKQQIIDCSIQTTQDCFVATMSYMGQNIVFTEEDLINQRKEAEQYYNETFNEPAE